MNPLPSIEPPSKGSGPQVWTDYYLTVIIIIMIGALVYQETRLSAIESTITAIQATLAARETIFANLAANDAKIVSNQDTILALLREHETTAVGRDDEIGRQLQHLTDICSSFDSGDSPGTSNDKNVADFSLLRSNRELNSAPPLLPAVGVLPPLISLLPSHKHYSP